MQTHVKLLIHQHPQVLLCRAPLSPLISQSVLIQGTDLGWGQDFALGLSNCVRFTELKGARGACYMVGSPKSLLKEPEDSYATYSLAPSLSATQ